MAKDTARKRPRQSTTRLQKNPTKPKRKRSKTSNGTASTLLPARKRSSLLAWFELYMTVEAGAPASNTYRAKSADLSRFAEYFQVTTGTDHADQWTRSISQSFVKHLLKVRSDRTGRKLAPTTVNRVLATVRNAARWIHGHRPFLAGYPMERISDVTTPDPNWKGLPDVAVTRLKSAAEQQLHTEQRTDQNAMRDQAILLVLLDTAFRVSELVSLDLEQYRGKHFHRVKRKGNNVTDRVFVGRAAKESLDRYLKHVRGRDEGPLFQSKNGNRLAVQDIARALERIGSVANCHLKKKQHIELTPHVLRHTSLRQMAEKKGVRYAQKMAGHASPRYIWRYVQPSQDEMEEAIEDLFD